MDFFVLNLIKIVLAFSCLVLVWSLTFDLVFAVLSAFLVLAGSVGLDYYYSLEQENKKHKKKGVG